MDTQHTTPPPPPISRRTLLRRAGAGSLVAGLVATGGSRSLSRDESPLPQAGTPATPAGAPAHHDIELVAQEFDWEISAGTVVRAWGYTARCRDPSCG